MEQQTVSEQIQKIRQYAYANDVSIQDVIALMRVEQEKIKNEHLSSIEYSLSEISSDLNEIRREKSAKNSLNSIENSIYSITTAIEKLQ